MSYRVNPGGGGIFGDIPPVVRQLILINTIILLATSLLDAGGRVFVTRFFALIPESVVTQGMVWQLFTYMFLHGGFTHLLFNMFGLYMFGRELEYWWGSVEFLKYYVVCGVGAGIIQMITVFMSGNPAIPTVGASGAVFGILLAYGLYFPNRQILLWFVFPMSARTLVILFAVLELVMGVQNPHSGIARFAHLGGMLVGFVYLKRNQIVWKAKQLLAQRAQSSQGRRPSHRDPVRSSEEEAKRKAEIDRILQKISTEGMGSLTPEERRLLEESAQRARNRQEPRT